MTGEMSADVQECRLLTVRDVAETLRVDEKTVRRKIERGLIPAYRLGPPGNSLRVSEDELSAWLAESRTAADDGPRQGQLRADAGTLAERRAPDSSPAVEARQPAGKR